jgi:hypothetical protein
MRRLVLAVILSAGLGVAMSGCGGAGEGEAGRAARSAGTAGEYIVPASNTISGEDPVSVARYPNGRENDETAESGADQPSPCRLVTRADASSIMGESVQTSVGSQGPTCIYASVEQRRMLTLTVERTSLARLRMDASTARRLAVDSRHGWCLRYGSTSVAVPLSPGSVLHVTGPCPLAARFAARALG